MSTWPFPIKIDATLSNQVVLIGGKKSPGGEFNSWTACEHPERPWDDEVVYHVMPACRGCQIAMDAHQRTRPLVTIPTY